ncbi:uncharacterized protein LOC114278580 [Camellia sinensis]|uniref:DUF4408 domain-containing protein n=1 Tax=Camellia sinensis var. sinensis TaxID=542762 RepID=A0A4V3WN76_CAMSN|nr:uncharacterized protein LOC114278580 [Camellia sinensis]THG11377.1 hypothetical protein TEA_018879 [Camellia sinensis var. sinensis]
MDENQNKKQKLQTTTSSQFNKHHQFLKMTLKFLVCVSLLSILFSYSSTLSHLFYYFKFHFSTLIFPLFSQTFERKYMFLICNGIIAFLAKNLSFASSSYEDGVKPLYTTEAQLQHKEAAMESTLGTLEKIEKQENESMDIKVHGRESQDMITETEDDEEQEASGSLIPQLNMSSEELNRTFDEFIRKMKEEIRIDALRQPIAV